MRLRKRGNSLVHKALLATILGMLMLGFEACALPSAPTDRYAIVIGITVYPYAYDNLSYPADDASSMASLLRSRGWIVDSSSVLTDANATKVNIQAAIASLASKLGSDSSVLVYYSGHGSISSDNSTAYLIPYDGIDGSGGFLQNNWIKPSDIDSWMTALPSNNRLLVLDSCYSGGFVDAASSADAAPQNYGPLDGGTTQGMLTVAFANASGLLAKAFASQSDPAILTISAAGSQELSYDDSGHQHGAFTYWFLQAGSDSAADSDGNKLVTATEAYAYAKNKLLANWDATNSGLFSGEFDSSGNPIFADFFPHISGGSGDIVLYDMR